MWPPGVSFLRYVREPYYPNYGYHGFPGSYPDHQSPGWYQLDDMYQAPTLDTAATLPTQHSIMWYASDTSPSGEVEYPYIGVPPLVHYSTQPEVTPFPVPTEGQGVNIFRPMDVPYPEAGTQVPSQNVPSTEKDDTDHRAQTGLNSRKLVPQKTYRPHRPQKEPGDSQIIEFLVRGGKGIRLSDALEGKWTGFEGKDDQPLSGERRMTIMLRLLPVGCPLWRSKIPITDYTLRRRPITRMKLAKEVARNVQKLLERERTEGHSDHSRCDLKDVLLSNIYLNRLVRVSTASWQPELSVVQPPT